MCHLFIQKVKPTQLSTCPLPPLKSHHLNRLQHMYGISGTALSWFSSHPTNRSQSVIINDPVLHASSLSCWVQQGSVLGPVLFTLYTKPLSGVIQCHSIKSQSLWMILSLKSAVPPQNIQFAIFSGNLDAGKHT